MDVVPHGENDCGEVDPLPRGKLQPRERNVCSLKPFHRHHLARLSVQLLVLYFQFFMAAPPIFVKFKLRFAV